MTEDVRDIWKFGMPTLYFIQEVLSLKREGESKMATLRKKGESICARKERKRHSVEERQRELEEEWARVLQTAWEMTNQIEREDSLSKELKSFQDQLESTQVWIRKLKVTLQSMDKASPAEEIITQAQVKKGFNILLNIFCIFNFFYVVYMFKTRYTKEINSRFLIFFIFIKRRLSWSMVQRVTQNLLLLSIQVSVCVLVKGLKKTQRRPSSKLREP